MNPVAEASRAGIGWLDLIAARAGAGDKFNLSRQGLSHAAGFYFAVVLLTLVVEGFVGRTPSLVGMLIAIALNAVPLLVIWLVCWLTARTLRAAPLALLVPVTYAMGFVLLIGLPLSLLLPGQGISYALLGALAFMLYRAARQMAGMGIGVSISFAILSAVLLVAVPIGLYMLTTNGQGIG